MGSVTWLNAELGIRNAAPSAQLPLPHGLNNLRQGFPDSFKKGDNLILEKDYCGKV